MLQISLGHKKFMIRSLVCAIIGSHVISAKVCTIVQLNSLSDVSINLLRLARGTIVKYV